MFAQQVTFGNGQAEVGQIGLAALVQEDVAGFDVTVNHIVTMSKVQRSAMVATSRALSANGRRSLSIFCARLVPSMYSQTRNQRSVSATASNIGTMCGCFKAAILRASARNSRALFFVRRVIEARHLDGDDAAQGRVERLPDLAKTAFAQ